MVDATSSILMRGLIADQVRSKKINEMDSILANRLSAEIKIRMGNF